MFITHFTHIHTHIYIYWNAELLIFWPIDMLSNKYMSYRYVILSICWMSLCWVLACGRSCFYCRKAECRFAECLWVESRGTFLFANLNCKTPFKVLKRKILNSSTSGTGANAIKLLQVYFFQNKLVRLTPENIMIFARKGGAYPLCSEALS